MAVPHTQLKHRTMHFAGKLINAGIVFYMILSVCLHFGVYKVSDALSTPINLQKKRKPIRMRIHQAKRKPQKIEKKSSLQTKTVIETVMKPTAPPIDYNYHGKQDHQTDKQTRVIPRRQQAHAKQQPKKVLNRKKMQQSAKALIEKLKKLRSRKTKIFGQEGNRVAVKKDKKSEKNKKKVSLSDLLPSGNSLLAMAENYYQETVIDRNIELGETISLNTRNFKYVSYFSSIKRAIELIWKYPAQAAQKGMQGETTLAITVAKTGIVEKVIVLKSSGYELLDKEAIATVTSASPFNPIPSTLDKNRLTITGTFVYRLSYFSIN